MELILLLVTVLLAAFFSGSETAFISARQYKLEAWVRQHRPGAKAALRLLKDPERFLTTTLVGTNVAIVTASTLMAIYLDEYFSSVVITLITSGFLLIFGEILPKSLARDRAANFAVTSHWGLRVSHIIFYPLIFFVALISRMILRLFGNESTSVKNFFSRKDLELLLREGAETGLVQEEDSALIENLLERGRRSIREAMVPRLEIEAIEKNRSIAEAIQKFNKTGYSRLLVYDRDIDHITGVLHVKDLVLTQEAHIWSMMKPVFFVPETLLMAQSMHQMQQANAMVAVIIDEYGGTLGLLTMEDLLEEYFGEMGDSSKAESAWIRKESDRLIDVNARAEIYLLNERYNLGLPEGEYQTLGGLILDKLGRIPKRGEKITLERCKLVVFSTSHNTIRWVRIIRLKNNPVQKEGYPQKGR